MTKPEPITYASRFQDRESVDAYESGEYAAGSYASQVWEWQRPVVAQIIQDFQHGRKAPVRLLDFACGTGRVLACVESLVDAAEGIDISENMVALARTKCRRAKLQVGDVLAQPDLLARNYDLIMAFRFLLNVEPATRLRVLRRLRKAIHPEGRLIVNVHGNSRSLRHPAIVWRRWRKRNKPAGAMLNEMSSLETRALLQESGFAVVRQLGFGMLPPTLYRTPLRPLAAAADRWFAGENFWKNTAIDMLFVCHPE